MSSGVKHAYSAALQFEQLQGGVISDHAEAEWEDLIIRKAQRSERILEDTTIEIGDKCSVAQLQGPSIEQITSNHHHYNRLHHVRAAIYHKQRNFI